MKSYPWYVHLILVSPSRVEASLDRIRASGLVGHVPNAWQIALGVLRMHHRLLFRSETVGTSTHRAVRRNWRARLLSNRAARFPFLVAERAIAPLDLSGLLSDEARMTSHLLCAHHDNNQFSYDLQILAVTPGALDRLLAEVRRVVAHDTQRSRWLRDICVFEGYHEDLLAAVERARAGDFGVAPHEEDDPDVTFFAYLRWCAAQPATPAETLAELRAGTYGVQEGVRC